MAHEQPAVRAHEAAQVLANADQGFHVFGSSGALVATVLTGLVLRQLLATGRPATAVSV